MSKFGDLEDCIIIKVRYSLQLLSFFFLQTIIVFLLLLLIFHV